MTSWCLLGSLAERVLVRLCDPPSAFLGAVARSIVLWEDAQGLYSVQRGLGLYHLKMNEEETTIEMSSSIEEGRREKNAAAGKRPPLEQLASSQEGRNESAPARSEEASEMETDALPSSGEVPLNFETSLPQDCRLRIISFLRPADLYGSYAPTSHQCHSDTLFSFLPQSTWVELHCGAPGTDLRHFLRRMGQPRVRSALPPCGKRRRVKLIGHSNLRWPDEWHYQRDSAPHLDAASLPGVTSLDLSSDATGDRAPFHFVTRALVRMFPSLRELDLTNVNFPVPATAQLRYQNEVHLGERAPLHVLEAMRWNNVRAGCRFLTDGYFFRFYPHLRELHLDNVIADCSMDTFDVTGAFGCLMDASDYALPQCHILSKCHRKLERVSLSGAGYYCPRSEQVLPLPQAALVKFARATPNLKWFRSDLAPGNVEVLRRELPHVVFEAGRRRYSKGEFGGYGKEQENGAACASAYVSW